MFRKRSEDGECFSSGRTVKRTHVRTSSSASDIKPKGPLRLLKRWRSKHDLDFGCSGQIDLDPFEVDEFGEFALSGHESAPSELLEHSAEDVARMRALEREREEQDAAEACLVYMAVEAMKRRTAEGAATEPTSPSSTFADDRRSSASSCLPYLDSCTSLASFSTASSRPLTCDSLAASHFAEASDSTVNPPPPTPPPKLTGPLQLPLPPPSAHS